MPARMRMPTRVKRRKANRPATATITTATMNTRYQVMKNRSGVIGCDSTSGMPSGSGLGPQMKRQASCRMKPRPKVSSRL